MSDLKPTDESKQPAPATLDHGSDEELASTGTGTQQEMPHQFSLFSTLSLTFSITNSWIGFSAVFVVPLMAGGGPGVIYGLLVAAVACFFINAGLAELASAYPNSGGQYHFGLMVSSPKTRALTAFIMGWLSVVAWCLTSASVSIYCAQICVYLAAFWNPEFVPTQWQIWLIFVLFLLIATAIVCYLPQFLAKTEGAFFLASLVGFVVFTISVLATSKTKQPASAVFTTRLNITGWDDGTAFLLGVGTCMYAFLATDSATHIAEEMPNPGRKVPQAICLTILVGLCTVMPWAIAFLFSATDYDELMASYLPILTLYYQALGNKVGATIFTCWLLLIYFGALVGCVATCGRQAWAFSRNNGLPYSKIFVRIHPTLQAPINATYMTTVFQILYGLIYIGSTTAFNSIISMSILSLNITYVIPQGIILWRGRDKVLPADRYFNLGPIFGPICNGISVAWVSLYTVLFCFPTFLPVAAASMNYVSVVIAGVILLILLPWVLGKKKTFTGHVTPLEGQHAPQVVKEET